ncbi:unnamed protein product, partial [Ectocarpus sp. 12 AP-2014]
VDLPKLRERREYVLAKMANRPGQQRKSRVADEFDSFVLSLSDNRRGWKTATDSDVLDWCCYLDSQGHGTTLVHAPSCPHVGSATKIGCPSGCGCATRYAAGSLHKSFVSN